MSEPTPTIGWRKRDEDGMFVVWDLPNGQEAVPLLDASQWNQIKMVEYKWGDLCREIGAKHQLPDGWLQAMIWRESGGDEHARNREGTPEDPKDDGIGLMQITNRALKGTRTDVELFVPRTNIEIGAGFISWLASRPDTRGNDSKPDFAEGEKFYAAQALAKQFSVPELLGHDFDKPAGIDDDEPPTGDG